MNMDENCDPKDIALKSFFLGPQAENSDIVNHFLKEVFDELYDWRRSLYPQDGQAISASDKASPSYTEKVEIFSSLLKELMIRFRGEIPKFSPRYIGHMLSDISLPALFGHIVTLLHNPNNVSGEASTVGTEIENEAVVALRQMINFPEDGSGHFTSGGTIANFEGLVRARSRMAKWISLAAFAGESGLFRAAHMGWENFDKLRSTFSQNDKTLGHQLAPYNFLEANPYEVSHALEDRFKEDFLGPVLLVPKNKHYSWKKGTSLLGLGNSSLWEIDLDEKGALCFESLEKLVLKAKAEHRPILAIVTVAGTTELGEIDPVDLVDNYIRKLMLEEGIYIWHHVDAAYGGFFCTLLDMPNSPLPHHIQMRLRAISTSNSVTIDPHKLGYVPYSSGAFLCRNLREYALNTFAAPYIAFTHNFDKGPFTLEGSRSAAGAVATWLTAKAIGLNHDGYGRLLKIGIQNKILLEQKLKDSGLPVHLIPGADTNIVGFVLAQKNEPASTINASTMRIYKHLGPRDHGPFTVSKTTFMKEHYGKLLEGFVKQWHGKMDTDSLIIVRLCMMNPFFDTKETDTEFAEEFISVLKDLY